MSFFQVSSQSFSISMSPLTFEEIRTRMSSAHSVGVAGRVERIFSRDILGGKIVYYLGGFYIFGEVSNYCHFVFPPLVYTTIILLPLWKSNDFSYVRRTKKICPIKWIEKDVRKILENSPFKRTQKDVRKNLHKKKDLRLCASLTTSMFF